jgi:hypothetical protein
MVKVPEVAKMLCPTDHPIATKRLCVEELSGILCQSQWLMSEAVVSNNC